MAESRSAASKSTVVDAIVLAFAHSDASEIVGTDALRSVLSVEYHDMVTSAGLDLTGLWELLKEQPGFAPAMAIPAMCTFKSWEDRLGMEITLPEDLAALSDKDLALESTKCKVPNAELRRVFGASASTSSGSGAAKKSKSPAAKKLTARDAEDKKRLLTMVAAAVVTIACFVFVGMQVYDSVRPGGDWSSAATSDISSFSVSSAEQFGDQLGVVASESSWHEQPREAKQSQLQEALTGLGKSGVRVLFVKDATGKVRATAQVSSKTGKMSFTFR